MAVSEFTVAQVLRDPLIRQMLMADKIALSDFAALLREAACRSRNGSARSIVLAQRPSSGLQAAVDATQ